MRRVGEKCCPIKFLPSAEKAPLFFVGFSSKPFKVKCQMGSPYGVFAFLKILAGWRAVKAIKAPRKNKEKVRKVICKHFLVDIR